MFTGEEGSKYCGGGGEGGGKVQNKWGWGQLFAGCKLIGSPAPNQCQIITFLILKTDDIAKLRIEVKSILLEISSKKKRYIYLIGTCVI